jgi:hypothetical protein
MTAAHDNAALAADVTNLKDQHAALRGEVRDFKADVANGFASIRTSIDSGLGRMSQALDTKTSTNWTPIGIVVSALVTIAVAFYAGLREQAGRHEAQIEALRDRQVPRIEHERVWREQAEDQRVVNERLRRLTDENVKVQIDLSFMKGQLNPLSVRPKE